ncbi:MAG: prephenate dehydrogenase/arogenate dehydrogenase family protein, partial [Bacteroidales bacterium]
MSKKVASVYGYGRFGRLWADILKTEFHVKAYSRRGLKPEEVNEGIEIVDIESLHQCDALFYCVAISSLEDVLVQTKPFHKAECVYFDTCSVKVMPVMWMKKHLPKKSSIIATHPMYGPDSYFNATERLPMVMSDIRSGNNEFDTWVDYFNSKNMRVEIMTADGHDKMVAYSQGITHYIGRVLADLKLETTSINTLGYKKLLEI